MIYNADNLLARHELIKWTKYGTGTEVIRTLDGRSSKKKTLALVFLLRE
jgi:hypothetical protein